MILRSILFALILAALPVCAADTNYVAAEWNLVDAHQVMAAAAQITPAQYPNCDSAIVEQNSVRDYNTDGTGACQDETFTKVLTEKGRRDNREQTYSFMLPYWTVSVPKLEIIKVDGTVVPVDVAANSKESIDEGQMAENIYDPNMRVLSVNIPQLDIGDTIHVVVRTLIHRSIMPDEYDEENVFEGTAYIRHLTYELHTPLNLPLVSIGLRDQVPGTITATTQTNSDSIDYRWEVANVPRMFDEPGMPPYDQVLQRLFVSTLPQWEDISKWYWNLSKPHLDMITPDMQETVSNLTANAPTDMDKIKALFYFVSKKIRYMGLTPEKDRPGFEPHDVCLTFDKRYGVCRDKAGLLVEMLRLAGFNAYPVLINIGAKRDMAVPQPDFDHAIVAVELTPGEYTLMDPTDENTRDLLPSYDRNRSYLVCKPEGETLKVSPVEPPEKHMVYVKTDGELNADGVLTATSEFSFEGVNDDAYRNALSQLKPDEQKKFFEERLKQAIPSVKLLSLKLTPENMLDTSVPLHAEMKLTASGLTANGNNKSIVNLPWISRYIGVANRVLLQVVGLKQRKYPLDTEYTCGAREDLTLKLTGGFAAPISVPEFSSYSDDSMGYSENVEVKNHMLVASRDFRLKTVEFSPDEYLKLRQTLKGMDYDRRKSLILALKSKAKEATVAANASTTPTVDSNAKLLSSEKTLTVANEHTATYHVKYSKKILTYDGKIRESQVKVEYNPACEEARIIGATVISTNGSRQEISPGEINYMDQGWNAGARRYTGGKILVASLPGVDIGSTIEVEYEVKMKNLPFLSGYEPFQLPDALDDKSFTLTAPFGLTVQKIISGPKGIVKELDNEDANLQTFEWHAKEVKALATEPDLPPAWSYQSGVSYYVGDVADYWNKLHAAMLSHARKSSNATTLAQQLTATAKTRLDAIKAIRDYIAENIRVAGPSFTDLPLSELSDADTTLSDGYGHSADCAILYYAMLKAVGFRPEFVMASDLPPVSDVTNVTQEFSLPAEFQTPLVRVTTGGEDYYLNDTDQYAQLGTTASDGKLGITLVDQSMITIHAAKDCADKTETDYAISVSDDGKAHIQISRWFYGQDFNDNNEFFSELPPEEREHYFQEAVSRVAQGARPVSDLTTKFATYPGLEQFTVELDHYGVLDGKYLYFNLPFTPALFDTLSDQRSLPLFLSDENQNILRAEIQWPDGFHETDIVPKNESFTAPGGSQASITKTEADGKCIVTDQFDLAPGVIKPKSYPMLLNIQSALGSRSGTTFLLERE
jgi:transglutaminase-like putative cysteine protease